MGVVWYSYNPLNISNMILNKKNFFGKVGTTVARWLDFRSAKKFALQPNFLCVIIDHQVEYYPYNHSTGYHRVKKKITVGDPLKTNQKCS